MNTVGDAIATLQVDQNGNKPQPTEAVLTLLDKLNSNQQQVSDQAVESVSSKMNHNLLTALKYAGILTVIVAVLNLPQIQTMLDDVFKNCWLKMAVQSLVFFIIATLYFRKVMKPQAPPVQQPQPHQAQAQHPAGF